jgi:hypothetical protein
VLTRIGGGRRSLRRSGLAKLPEDQAVKTAKGELAPFPSSPQTKLKKTPLKVAKYQFSRRLRADNSGLLRITV